LPNSQDTARPVVVEAAGRLLGGTSMQEQESPDPEQFVPDMIDVPEWRPVVGDELKFVMWSAVVLAILAAMFWICRPVCGDELVPEGAELRSH